jgi:hypothetical protein
VHDASHVLANSHEHRKVLGGLPSTTRLLHCLVSLHSTNLGHDASHVLPDSHEHRKVLENLPSIARLLHCLGYVQ